MVNNGNDIVVIGGKDDANKYSGSLYRLSCWNHVCSWETLSTELEFPRMSFLAIPLPDDFLECNNAD